MAPAIGAIIADLFIESVPLGLFFLLVLVIGNILKHLFISNNLDDICHETIKLDLFSLTSGLLVTLIPIFYRNAGILDISSLKEQGTLIGVLITSLIAGFIIWNYRVFGKKWIKDKAQVIFGMLLTGFLFYAAYNAIIESFNILSYRNCLGDKVCLIKFAIEKLFKIGLAALFIIWGFKLFKFINKERRYKKNKSSNQP